MVYSRQHTLIRAIGHFGASASDVQDEWSVGMRLAIPGGTGHPAGPYTTLLESIATPIQTFHAANSTGAGFSCFLDELTAALIGVDGKYPAGAVTDHRLYGTPVSGGGGTNVLPWESALVISLRTANARGYASNGRIYWPCGGLAPGGTTGRVADAAVQSRVNGAKTMFDAINTAANTFATGLRLCVMSSVGLGTTAAVTRVRSDGRIDSIERRENNMPSVYLQATLA